MEGILYSDSTYYSDRSDIRLTEEFKCLSGLQHLDCCYGTRIRKGFCCKADTKLG